MMNHMLTFIHFSNILIRRCGKLSTLLGIHKSFSTSDIDNKILETTYSRNRQAISELTLNSIQRYGYMLDSEARLSLFRSCSTWVQLGELASTSQLPSPHGLTSSQQQLSSSNLFGPNQTASTSQSVNKNIRENYIRSRLLTTHRAIERLSQSEFNLDQLTIAVSEGPGPTELVIPEQYMSKPIQTEFDDTVMQLDTTASPCSQRTKYRSISATNMSRNITIQDIEKERGRPLSKYDRNYMIFNWLHSLDETSTAEDSQ